LLKKTFCFVTVKGAHFMTDRFYSRRVLPFHRYFFRGDRIMLKKGFFALFVLLFTFASFAIAPPAHCEDPVVFANDFAINDWHLRLSYQAFISNNSGAGILTIQKTTPDKQIDGGFVLLNSQFILLRDFLTGAETEFIENVELKDENYLVVFLRGSPGASIHLEIYIKSILQPQEVTFTAIPTSVALGDSSALAWSTKNVDSCTMEPGIGSVDIEGSFIVSPTETTTYTLTATGPGGSLTAAETVAVTYPPPEVSIGADKKTLETGQSAILSWISKYAASCAIAPGIGNVERNGSILVSPAETTTYTITATNPGGNTTDSATVTVNDPKAPPTVNFSATPLGIEQGRSSTLAWTSYNASVAHIDNGIGAVEPNGSIPVSPEHTTMYTLTVTGPTGSANVRAVVTVLGNQFPQPQGSFGGHYADLIPVDATVEEYDYRRFSLITGLVQDPAELPIANVSITIHDHPGYGSVTTDAEGRFSIPVDGGGNLTVVFQKKGLITIHRKVYVPWNDIAMVETVQMISEDPVSTTLTFDGNPDTVVTHQSTPVADEFGSRSTSVVFTGDNRAFLVDSNGDDVQELTTITTRATEYTTPKSMPAQLPPASAFTYCAEFSVDGAERVRFEKPVTIWVNNFLGFPVGVIVPVGYYDRDKGIWMPMENGVVVQLLDTEPAGNPDGKVDALDADGDGLPDDLDEDGTFTSEVQGLDDSQKYTPGTSFWKAAVTHFSPLDFNWPFGPPTDAISPNPKGPAIADQEFSGGKAPGEQPPDDTRCIASFVEQRSRILHEDINIPGTAMNFHYTSSRVAGFNPGVFSIPASGDTVPGSLIKIIVDVKIAGKTYQVSLPAAPNQLAEIEWDGLDYLGRPAFGPLIGYVRIGFVYYGLYYRPNPMGRSFGQSGISTLMIPTQQEIIFWEKVEIPVLKGQGTLAEGWSLSAHHYVSPVDPSILFKGDGTVNRNNAVIIDTFAGNGSGGFGGMGGPATEAGFIIYQGIATDSADNLYINTLEHVSFQNWRTRVLKVDSDGIMSERCRLTGMHTGIVLDALGNLYLSENLPTSMMAKADIVVKVDPSGKVSTFAGRYNRPGFSGDGGPAIQAQLNHPMGLDVDNEGNFYIADTQNNCIRKVDTAGIITTVAGRPKSSSGGYSGDNGPATEAKLKWPHDVAVDSAGNLFIADTNNHVIRKVETSGVITTVAGNGEWGASGDGGPAVEAALIARAVDLDAAGNIYIVDDYYHRVRKVDINGIITTVAGTVPFGYSEGGFGGDGGPATAARLNKPDDIALDAAGNIFVADSGNSRIRKISPPGPRLARLISESDMAFPDQTGVAHILSGEGLHKKTIDLDTGVSLYAFSYDEKNNLTSIKDRFGNLITVERNGNGVLTAIISPDQIRTALTIDASNHLTRVSYADDSYYDFEYTADGLMTAKIDPEGNRFGHTFNAKGRLTAVTDEQGGYWGYTRTVDEYGNVRVEMTTAENNATSYLDHTASNGVSTSDVTDTTGAQSAFSKSGDGLTVNHLLPCGMEMVFHYDVDSEYNFRTLSSMTETAPSGLARASVLKKTYKDTNTDELPDLITDTISVNNKTTTITHNTLQTQKMVTSPEGRTATMRYNSDTLLTTGVSVPGLFDISYGYNAQGKLTSITTNTRQFTYGYNLQGFLESVTDSGNQTTTYSYDPLGRMTGIARPDDGTVEFAYNKNGNMTVLTNPVDVDHGFGYNSVNRKSSYQTPLSGSYSYIYDKDRRLIQTNFPSGKSIFNDYADPGDPDDKSRLWQIRTPEGNIDFTYLCGTKVESIAKGTESVTYGYDGKLVTSETFSGTLNQALDYAYNNNFDVSSSTYAGATANYSYDHDGLLTGAGHFSISRNAGNGLPETVSGGALNIARTFNGYGELEGQDDTVSSRNVTTLILTRDNKGKIIRKTETVGGVTANFAYTYDSMGRLLTATKDGNLVEQYSYDLNGTRTYEMNSLRGIAGRSYSYSDEDHLLTAGSVTYAYDLDGFLTTRSDSGNVTTYNYSSRVELLSVNLPDGRLIEYIHDPLGRRIAKKVNGTIVEKYLWQGLTRLLAVYDGSNNLLMRFEYADARMPVAMTNAGTTYYLLYDQVGSLRVVADSAGNVVKRIDYDSFGNIIDDTNPAFAVPFGFAGGLYDPDTKLVRFGHRDYDPDVGRWTAKDPILFAGGDTDLYGYVLNDPINKFDPLGLADAGMAMWGSLPPGQTPAWIPTLHPLKPSDLIPSKQFLSDTETASMIFATGSAVTGNTLGAIVFGGINLSAGILKSSLYSDSPCNDAIKEGVKQSIPAPPGLDPIKDEIVDRSIDWYIEEFNLPKM
jgi:RHS repeat-associated protein